MNPAFGWTAIAAAFAAGWNQVRSFFARVSSLVIVKAELNDQIAESVLSYCWRNMRRSPFGMRRYSASKLFVRPLKRYQNVGYEQIGHQAIIFWSHGFPVLLGYVHNERGPDYISVTFLRGTLNLDAFVIKTMTEFNDRQSSGWRRRFEVIRFSGSGSPLRGRRDSDAPGNQPVSAKESHENIANGSVRLLRWKWDEVGAEMSESESALEALAFPKEIHAMVDEVKHWKMSEPWYREKQIPWRRGWLLYGKPGTGKTSLVRAIAQDLDLPVCLFDLATMSNEEMIRNWREMLGHAPCIALMEDVDSIFSGRENKLGQEGGGLSFDCLLNCISGIDSANGVFLVITTNRIDQLDEALGVPRSKEEADGTTISTRPGRIDRALELPTLDDACRLKLAARILADCPEYTDDLVQQGEGDTGAQFQERCSQIALRHHWNKLKSLKTRGTE